MAMSRDRMRVAGIGRWLAVVVLVGIVSGCGGKKANPLRVTVMRCPAPAVVEGLSTLTRFANGRRTADAVLFTASIEDLALKCEQGERVRSLLRFRIVAIRGPALRDDVVEVPYFVAVMRDNGEIVAKKIYRTRLVFARGAKRAETVEEILQTIPSIDQARRYDYELLVGFQVKTDDLIFNVVR
ncbi:MAG: hypothetical protein D6740_10090 [Alphaproteobacteria bacterium]|nr:MAG: hypothetical protein D6740_10090 [Alphaproteobacteria bacterium]